MVHKQAHSRKTKKKEDNVSLRKKDFETFAFGVQRLKELKSELDSLNTRGFYQEAEEIKSKLKTVSEIPNIERLLKILKLKINKKYVPQKRKKPQAVKEIHEDIEDLKGAIKGLRSNKGVGLEEIKGEIKGLKKSDRRNLEEIKKEISSIKHNQRKGPVDSEVELLVDANFNDFLSETKKALSERIQNREKEMNSILRTDLEKREDKYKQKHAALLKEFADKRKAIEKAYSNKYKKRVDSTLHKEISTKFNKMLNVQLDKEKEELSRTYKKRVNEHAHNEIERRKAGLAKEFKARLSKRLRTLQETYHRRIAEEEKTRKRELTVIAENKLRISQRLKELGKQYQTKLLEVQKQNHHRLLEEQKRKERELLDMEQRKKELLERKQQWEIQRHKDINEMKQRFSQNLHEQLSRELRKKEQLLRSKLSNEYELKLKNRIQEHENDLKRKKMELELDMQKKIKQFFN